MLAGFGFPRVDLAAGAAGAPPSPFGCQMCSPASEFLTGRQPESGCATGGKPNFETGRQRRILRGGRAEENDGLTGRCPTQSRTRSRRTRACGLGACCVAPAPQQQPSWAHRTRYAALPAGRTGQHWCLHMAVHTGTASAPELEPTRARRMHLRALASRIRIPLHRARSLCRLRHQNAGWEEAAPTRRELRVNST